MNFMTLRRQGALDAAACPTGSQCQRPASWLAVFSPRILRWLLRFAGGSGGRPSPGERSRFRQSPLLREKEYLLVDDKVKDGLRLLAPRIGLGKAAFAGDW